MARIIVILVFQLSSLVMVGRANWGHSTARKNRLPIMSAGAWRSRGTFGLAYTFLVWMVVRAA
ncbi:hypothetical protein DQ353_13100 [Arthrobacter sp. AQ5-05]|nr:hypothetical protein DQ353_13100 [Arthrobacter sp. AQ5-05]